MANITLITAMASTGDCGEPSFTVYTGYTCFCSGAVEAEPRFANLGNTETKVTLLKCLCKINRKYRAMVRIIYL